MARSIVLVGYYYYLWHGILARGSEAASIDGIIFAASTSSPRRNWGRRPVRWSNLHVAVPTLIDENDDSNHANHRLETWDIFECKNDDKPEEERCRVKPVTVSRSKSPSSFQSFWKTIPRGGSDEHSTDTAQQSSSPSSAQDDAESTLLLLRIRLPDGSLQKIQLTAAQVATLSLHDLVTAHPSLFSIITKPDDIVVADAPSSPASSMTTLLRDLNVTNGSILTLRYKNQPKKSTNKQSAAISSSTLPSKDRFDPFPDLAKDYDSALSRHRRRRATSSKSSSSYSAVANLQSSLHVVEAQTTPAALERVYMCHVSASRFRDSSNSVRATTADTATATPATALLFGTVSRERKDQGRRKKAQTSLSSTVESDEYCQAVRVHALWEPPISSSSSTISLLQEMQASSSAVRRVASYLGLSVVGWIFAYSDSHASRTQNDGLPVLGPEIAMGAQLQIAHMKEQTQQQQQSSSTTNSLPAQLLTLAMDASTGTTEAFQLSDVAVQMVAEDLFVLDKPALSNDKTKSNDKSSSTSSSRYVTMRHPVIVDGKETNTLDSVLCLVNTALLSHQGWYSGGSSTSSSTSKKTGALTRNTRKALLKALQDDTNNKIVMELLCDLNVLVALDQLLTPNESELLCRTVTKYARGQKTTATLSSTLRQRLQQLLSE